MNLETVHGFISSKNLEFNVNKDFQHKQNMFCIQGFSGSVSGRDGNGESIFVEMMKHRHCRQKSNPRRRDHGLPLSLLAGDAQTPLARRYR